MEQRKNSSLPIGFYILLAVCMIAAAAVFLFKSITDYYSYINESRNAAMDNVADAADQTILSMYNDYEEELKYILNTDECQKAEQNYLSTKDATDLFHCLEDSLLNEKEAVQTMLVYNRERIICSTDRKNEYFLPALESMDQSFCIEICTDYNNRIYLGFFRQRGDLCYGALMKIRDFYETVEKNSGTLSLGELLLLDRDHNVYLHRKNDKFRGDLLYEEGDLDHPLLQMMIRSESGEKKDILEYQDQNEETSYVRVASYPVSVNVNPIFSIGVLRDSEKEMLVVRKLSIQLMAFTAMLFAGLAVIVFLLVRMSTQNEKSLKEIRILQEKKDTIEALNRETLEFAHHQRLETIGQLTAGIAHDFNNLLTPIMGYSVLVMEKLPPEDTESYDNLLEVYNASRKAKELISRLSDLSRKNSASTLKNVNADRMIQNAVLMAKASKPKNIRLVQELFCKDACLYGNEVQFSQVLLNLLINAFHALEPDGGLVRVSSYQKDGNIVIRVQDDGCGIPEEIREKIFQPFFTTKSFDKGTGLGLAIVQQVVEEYKGSIQLKSEVGRGTEFILRFPASTESDNTVSETLQEQ